MAITMTATLMRRISMRLIACLVLANFTTFEGLRGRPARKLLDETYPEDGALADITPRSGLHNASGMLRDR